MERRAISTATADENPLAICGKHRETRTDDQAHIPDVELVHGWIDCQSMRAVVKLMYALRVAVRGESRMLSQALKPAP